MKRVVLDIEANGLLKEADQLWCVVSYELESKDTVTFCDHVDGYRPMSELPDYLDSVDQWIGHNICMYDAPLLKKVIGYEFKGKLVDSLIMSQILNFDRRLYKAPQKHGLADWGEHFGVPKPKQEQWTVFESAMVHRCTEDVRINALAFDQLIQEFKLQPQTKRALQLEFKFAEVIAKQEEFGWAFDVPLAKEHLVELDTRIEELRSVIEPQIPVKVKPSMGMITWQDFNKIIPLVVVPKDYQDESGRVERPIAKPNKLRFLKSGLYDKNTCKYFNIGQESSFNERLVEGSYTKVEFIKSTMRSHVQVKKLLLANGWIPTTYNLKKGKHGELLKDYLGQFVKASPKLTPDSFGSIRGQLGEDIALFNTLTSRRQGIENPKDDTKGWLNNLQNGRIHGGGITCGTATGRMSHRNIVNVPSSRAVFGKEIRKLFVAEPDRVLVSADADALQLRLLASHMGDDDYTKACVSGVEYDDNGNYVGSDIHTLNTRMAGISDDTMDNDQLSKARGLGKGMIYCLVFGGGDAKLGDTIKQGSGAKLGKKTRALLMKNLPKLEKLIDHIRGEVMANEDDFGVPFLFGADGRRVLCSSPHKALNYLLQSDEAILMKLAAVIADKLISQYGLDSRMVGHFHDEYTFSVVPKDVDKMKEICEYSINKAGNELGFGDIITGSALSGSNWAEIH